MFAHAVMVAICGAGTYHIFQHQSFSYMDEIFHIPQAQKYCNGTFSEVSSSNDDEFFLLIIIISDNYYHEIP